MNTELEPTDGHVLNARARAGLHGTMALGPSGVGQAIVDLLRSDFALERDVREALAAAIERGLFGNRSEEQNEFGHQMPWLEIGGMGRDGRVGEAIKARRNWFDAAEELERRRAGNERGYKVLDAVGSEFGLGVDALKAANTFRKRFLAEIDAPGSELVASVLNASGDNEFDPDPHGGGPSGGNHYFLARALFIDREAEAVCK